MREETDPEEEEPILDEWEQKAFLPPGEVAAARGTGREVGERFSCRYYDFEYDCPRSWERLRETEDPSIRTCGECKRQVYICSTIGELKRRDQAGECLVFFEDRAVSEYPIELVESFPMTPDHEVGRIADRLEKLVEKYSENRSDPSVVYRIARLSALLGENEYAKQFAVWYLELTGEVPVLPEPHPRLGDSYYSRPEGG